MAVHVEHAASPEDQPAPPHLLRHCNPYSHLPLGCQEAPWAVDAQQQIAPEAGNPVTAVKKSEGGPEPEGTCGTV